VSGDVAGSFDDPQRCENGIGGVEFFGFAQRNVDVPRSVSEEDRDGGMANGGQRRCTVKV